MTTQRSRKLAMTTLAILVTLTVATAGSGNGTHSKAYALAAQPQKDAFKTGEPIILRLSLSNDSADEIYIIETSATKDNQLEIMNGRGEKVAMSERGKRRLASPELRRIISKVGAGQAIQYAINVSDLYDFAGGDTYTVKVKRKILMANKRTFAEVKSHPVKVSVEL